MKNIILLLFTFFVVNISVGQNINTYYSDSSFHNRGVGMYLIFPKLELASFSELNASLSEYDYPTLPRQTFNWGIGLQYRWGLFLLNLDVMMTRQQEKACGSGDRIQKVDFQYQRQFSLLSIQV